jgi:RNA polymerase sigma-70 factor, ECF subfamily
VNQTRKRRVATPPSLKPVAVARPMQEPQEGNENRIWQACRAELYGFVLKRVLDEALAEDIVHDVLITAYTRWETLKDSSKLRPWLYQIARHAIIDYYRAAKPSEPVPEDLVSEEGDADDRARQELARCLVPLVNRLAIPYRRALTLADLNGLTQREVASRLGLSLSGAKARVQRARKMVAGALLECCRVELDHRGGVMDYECRQGCGSC